MPALARHATNGTGKSGPQAVALGSSRSSPKLGADYGATSTDHTVDGRNPAPIGNYWELSNTVNNGITLG